MFEETLRWSWELSKGFYEVIFKSISEKFKTNPLEATTKVPESIPAKKKNISEGTAREIFGWMLEGSSSEFPARIS